MDFWDVQSDMKELCNGFIQEDVRVGLWCLEREVAGG